MSRLADNRCLSDVISGWFPQAQSRTNADVRFLAHLRLLALDWGELGLVAGRSMSVPIPKPLVGIELPYLSAPLRWLWILFLESPEGLAVDCEWGDDARFNDWGPRDGNVYASTPDPRATPEAMAERASHWVRTQAGRAVRRDDWSGRRPRTRWTFEDTGAILCETRFAFWGRGAMPDATRTETMDH